ncbi:MAG: NYN domain-containing protein [Candidatus Wildermuthbacteria bacterium]|nr:NYN domain-containing protein [Candidatus Wildermuthbacteria bacterium]
MKTFAFIDASNLFYGGEKSLGWKIDYEKLRGYLERKYGVSQLYYFGGVEIHHFPFDYLTEKTVNVRKLDQYLSRYVKERGDQMNDAELKLVARHHNRVCFFLKLESFGYTLVLKPVKTYNDMDGNPLRKANCDVDMTLMMATEKDSFDRAIVLSGDGDFLPVFKYLCESGREVLVLARGPRTAKEIKRFAGSKFLDFEYLRTYLEYEDRESSGL